MKMERQQFLHLVLGRYKMAITYGFFNAIKQTDGTYDRVYNADQMSTYFEGLISDGVYEKVDDAMRVLAGAGMQVQVGAGRAIIDSRWIKNTAAYLLEINAAHVTLNRYTAVVIRLDLSSRTIVITTKDSENATTPVKPSMTNSETIKEMCLAYIYVGRGVTSITQSNIEDTRPDSNVCGWVTGIVQQVDTSKLFLQWQTAYEEFYKQMQDWQEEQESLFDKWFSNLTGQLQVNTYIDKTSHHFYLEEATGSFLLDTAENLYDKTDIIMVYLNGLKLVEGEEADYIIDTSQRPTSIEINYEIEAGNDVEIIILKSKIGQT